MWLLPECYNLNELCIDLQLKQNAANSIRRTWLDINYFARINSCNLDGIEP